jgi:hypothetical protein
VWYVLCFRIRFDRSPATVTVVLLLTVVVLFVIPQPSTLLEYTGYSTGRILAVARMMASKIREEVVTVSRRELMAVKRKYDEEKYDYISVDFDAPDVNDISSD